MRLKCLRQRCGNKKDVVGGVVVVQGFYMRLWCVVIDVTDSRGGHDDGSNGQGCDV